MVDTNIVYATDTYVNFLKFLHVLRGMISDDRARTKYKYMEYASRKICYFRVRHVHDLSSPVVYSLLTVEEIILKPK